MVTALIDSRMSDSCERRLNILGFRTVRLPSCPTLPEAIASHPDTLICRIGNRIITSADYCEYGAYIFSDLREYYPKLQIDFAAEPMGEKYPDDCHYNALTMENKIFARAASLSSKIKEYATKLGYETVDVKQGYPACATLKISDTDAITSDAGLAKKLEECKVKVTKIGNIGISLPPYEYGFIGGASGVYKDTVYFIGDLDSHPDAAAIRAAISAAGKRAVSLSDEELVDLGGIIFID